MSKDDPSKQITTATQQTTWRWTDLCISPLEKHFGKIDSFVDSLSDLVV